MKNKEKALIYSREYYKKNRETILEQRRQYIKNNKGKIRKRYIDGKMKFEGINILWVNMKQRCHNSNYPRFKDYGGRGIVVCKEWRDSFQVFYEWVKKNGRKEGLTIDRRNNNGNYTPENCRFVTRRENMRNSSNVKLDMKSIRKIKKLLKKEQLSFKKIAKIFDIGTTTISDIKIGKRWADVN